MSISREDYEKAKKLEVELIMIKDAMDNVRGYPTRVKGDTFYITLNCGERKTFLFLPPYMRVEITNLLYGVCQKEYRRIRENFDRLFTEQE